MRQTRSVSHLRSAARTAFAVVVLAASASLLPLTEARAQVAGQLFEQIGELDRFGADARAALGEGFVPVYDMDPDPFKGTDDFHLGRAGTALVIPEARQVWQFYVNTNNDSAAVIRDLDSLKIVKTLVVPGGVDRGTIALHAGEWAHAIDTKGLRLFTVTSNFREALEIDLRTLAVKRRPLLASFGPASFVNSPFMVGGLTYDPHSDSLLLLYGGPPANSAADTNTFLYTLDVSGPSQPANLDRFHQLQSCNGPMSSVDAGGETYNWEILPDKDFLYVPCHRAGNAGVVVRMQRPTPGGARPVEDIVVGPVYVDTVMVDPAGGRLFLTTIEREIWVFETKTMSFVGIVATGPERTQNFTGYGLDRTSGRLFFQSSTFGLGVVEGRFFPIPQARTMPHLVSGQERIFSDPQTGRLFVLDGDNQFKARMYRIYRTDAAPVPPPPPDPDRNTIDIAEKEGVTERRYFASGSGYGMRVILAKGLAPVAPAPTVGIVSPTAQAIDKNVNSKCGYTDRELVAGRVYKAEYDTGSTAASAIAFDIDGATKQDFDKPSRCDVRIRDAQRNERISGIFATKPVVGGPDLPFGPILDEVTQAPRDDPDDPNDDHLRRQFDEAPRWNVDRAECTSSEEAGKQSKSAEVDHLGPSTTDCPLPDGTLEAKAASGLSGGVSVEQATTVTTIERTSAGVVSKVTAVAYGVNIGGAITFAEIRSTATSTSNGRPKKDAMSTHDVKVRGAAINGQVVCDNCQNLPALVKTLNSAAGGRALFRTGEGTNSGRDEALVEGSKRGALTAVQKSAARLASDRALVGDFTTEVPGLEMTVFNDNTEWGRARQLYQFAGVASAATYNIVLKPTGFPFGDDPNSSFDEDFGEPSIGDKPFSGIVESIDEGDEFSDISDMSDAQRTVDEGGGNEDGGGFLAPFRALARGIRLFFTNPRHSLLLLTAWALFSLPGVLSRRRRLLAQVRAE